jgi:hypothetical protein
MQGYGDENGVTPGHLVSGFIFAKTRLAFRVSSCTLFSIVPRKPKAAALKQVHLVPARFTKNEFELLRSKSQAEHLPLASFVRITMLKHVARAAQVPRTCNVRF